MNALYSCLQVAGLGSPPLIYTSPRISPNSDLCSLSYSPPRGTAHDHPRGSAMKFRAWLLLAAHFANGIKEERTSLYSELYLCPAFGSKGLGFSLNSPRPRPKRSEAPIRILLIPFLPPSNFVNFSVVNCLMTLPMPWHASFTLASGAALSPCALRV